MTSAARRSAVGCGEVGFTRKKSLVAAEQQRWPDVKARRDAWLDTLTTLCGGGDFARVIFLDESGALTWCEPTAAATAARTLRRLCAAMDGLQRRGARQR